MTEFDAELVALIDGELEEPRRSAMLKRLAADPELKARFDELSQTSGTLRAAFDALLQEAPSARLNAMLRSAEAARPRRLRRPIAWRELAAGIALGLALAGAAWLAAVGVGSRDEEDWRSAVVDYAQLYGPETLAMVDPDPETAKREIGALAERLGLHLTPDNIALPGLRFRMAVLFRYENAPLGEIAYVDASGEPVLFCVLAHTNPNEAAATFDHEGLTVTSWSQGGREFLVVGRIDRTRAQEFARTLATRL